MKALDFLTPQGLFIEIGQSSLKLLDGEDGLELPIERLENGRLTGSCRERLILSLRGFLKKQAWQPRRRALCAVGARGVSLRRLTLPSAPKEELQRLLLLQIENEFPLPPDELAWGSLQLSQENGPRNGATAGQEFMVVAVKRESLEEYSEILTGCGLNPVFTLSALARSSLCAQPFGSYAVLDIGRSHSELISFDKGAPDSIRILAWGGEDMTRSIEKKLALSRDEAEKLKITLEQASVSSGELGQKAQAAVQAELESLAGLINWNWIGQKLYVTGKSSRLKEIAPWLGKALGGGLECERMEVMPGQGRSAATLGLKSYWEKDEGRPPLTIEAKKTKGGESMAQPDQWKWAALACLLAIGLLSFRYVEAIFWKPRLSKKLSQTKAYQESLPKIDRQLSFLRYLETNQPPYLDAMFIVANAAAPGTRFDSLSMNRRGDLSLRGTMLISQTTEFRSKLIDSGFFATVVVEEQTPMIDRMRAVVRITAQLKPAETRPSLPAIASSSKDLKSEKPAGEAKASALGTRGAPTGVEAIRR